MALPIEDYALIGDRHTAALVGTERLGRLAVPAPLRLPRLLRRPARHRRPRPLAARPGRRAYDDHPPLRRRHRASWRRRSPPPTASVVPARPDADRRRPRRRRPHGSRARAARCGCATSGWCASTTARSGRGSRRAADRRRARSITAVAGPDKLVLRGPRLPHGRRPPPQRRVRRRRGRRADLLDDLGPVVHEPARAARLRRPDRGHHRRARASGPRAAPTDVPHADVVRRSLLTLRLMTHERDRRHRRGAHHLAARGLRRRAQLGLPLLLAARRRADPRVAARRRLHRRGRRWRDWLLRAVAGDPEDLQIMYAVDGGAAAARARARPPARLRRLAGRSGSATARSSSGRPTCSAR